MSLLAATALHVVIIGMPAMTWSDVSPSATPALWSLAEHSAVGELVDFAVQPRTCPADGWLTLNSGARAQSDHTSAECGGLPAVWDLPAIAAYNRRFDYDPRWGLLASAASCSTAVGPGAALALGRRATENPAPARVSARLLDRCPLTIIDMTERGIPIHTADTALSRVAAELPADAILLVFVPGADSGTPSLRPVLVSGPGYRHGLLDSRSTRQPGVLTLTDLTPAVLNWLGDSAARPLTESGRGSLASTARALAGRDVAESVWRSTHVWFFLGYGLFDLLVLGTAWRGCRGWRAGAAFATAIPAGTFLAGLVPWWLLPHPAVWQYAMSVAWAGLIAGLAVRIRRDASAPFGIICLVTLVIVGADVMTGSRLELDAPFGLSLLEAGRYYGLGNEALGVYGAAALAGAGWLAAACARPRTAVAAVGIFAVTACGWPGFGAKAGAVIALTPCFLLLFAAVAGVRVSRRRIAVAAVSGLGLAVVFAVIDYLAPRLTGGSDLGAFAGSLLHGGGGGLLRRKVSSALGTLIPFGWLVPSVLAMAAVPLWRHRVARLIWLLLVLGWLADDSGIIVPAVALPFVVPLCVGMLRSASYADGMTRYGGTAFAGSSVAGQTA